MIYEILSEACIQTDVKVKRWRDAVYICGEMLLEHKKITPAYIDSMIDTAKQMGASMMLLPEIAFFHGVSGSKVKQTCLSLITFEKPVIFEEFHGIEIKAAVAFGAINRTSYMELLANLAALLQNETFATLLRKHGTKSELLEIIKFY
ncbi:PTS system ascorbate-specific IIA component [Breznakia sp. PF5-3]|uniref:PTS sugar transporter subunit IIA n=1 Tax=unclassified Breznakia TaxID=2623764 RepID=UPI002404D728|nr:MULTISPECIES: PTS sugar transporter subunit IIA [unclassified Breznakia]MDL2276405.1 PTS sugar transporter subunit IIA [Breznakia sp. OttesenSCG-928-G09]MDF9823791.1 PTS system ascorbate-specific IIA component [Breznakia sp. PM6-1]MDF9834643.1 PTS system ascorbate-specific IIA component [Breznakia sp. PF5-3]MDF9836740.1 PTS system ascorbate-specific IIA component [Breznakia sp. PFB2-8]MDF9858811.1 PTS system ascorbate-specific IIA component [Breznakia sp. PH5-24]